MATPDLLGLPQGLSDESLGHVICPLFSTPPPRLLGLFLIRKQLHQEFLDLFEKHSRPVLELHERQCSGTPAEI